VSAWVDFAELKQTVRLEWVLEHYGITALRRGCRGQYRGRCPIHGGEGRDAFHVNRAKQVFHCFSCGAGGTVLDLVAALEGCGLRQAALWLADQFGPLRRGLPAPGARQLVTEKRALTPLRFRLRGIDPTHPYLRQRGIANDTAAVFGVGYYPGPGLLQARVVIPIADEHGELVAYCGRSIDGREPRYRFPAGFAKSQVLFNLHRAAGLGERRVVIVEGFFDCFQVHQAGIGSVVALMGVCLSARQEQLLRQYFSQIAVMLDGDRAGRCASRTIATRLARAMPVRVGNLPDGWQPDQLAATQIREFCRSAGTQ